MGGVRLADGIVVVILSSTSMLRGKPNGLLMDQAMVSCSTLFQLLLASSRSLTPAKGHVGNNGGGIEFPMVGCDSTTSGTGDGLVMARLWKSALI
jgi:hypothetical protein